MTLLTQLLTAILEAFLRGVPFASQQAQQPSTMVDIPARKALDDELQNDLESQSMPAVAVLLLIDLVPGCVATKLVVVPDGVPLRLAEDVSAHVEYNAGPPATPGQPHVEQWVARAELRHASRRPIRYHPAIPSPLRFPLP